MKIALAIKEDKGLDSPVDEHFGSSQHFLIVDTKANTTECIENKKLSGEGGCKTDLFDESLKVEAVITQCMGDGLRKKLTSSNIKVYQASKESVRENLELFENNDLKLFHIFDHCQAKKNKKEGGCGH